MSLRTFKEIELFVAVYKEGSFTKAARAENATQPGVSRYILELEKSLGVQLFTRNKNSVIATPAGHHFYAGCMEILRRREQLVRSVSTYKSDIETTITVGLIRALTRRRLPSTLLRFTEAHPNVTLRVVEGYSKDLLQHLSMGRLDFAVVPALANTSGFATRPLLSVRESLVMSRRPERNSCNISLREHNNLRLILPGADSVRRSYILEYLNYNCINVESYLEVDTVVGILGIINEGGWSAILPTLTMSKHDLADFDIMPLVRPELRFNLLVAYRADHVLTKGHSDLIGILGEEEENFL